MSRVDGVSYGVLDRIYGDPRETVYRKLQAQETFTVDRQHWNFPLDIFTTDFKTQTGYMFTPNRTNLPRLSTFNVMKDDNSRTFVNPVIFPVSEEVCTRSFSMTIKFLHFDFKVLGLAVDWVSRNLYWTDASFNWIGMAPLEIDDKFKFIVTEKLFTPHGIGVHPKSRSVSQLRV